MSIYGFQEAALAALDGLQRELDDVRAEVKDNHTDENGASYLLLSTVQRLVTQANYVAQRLLQWKEMPQ